MTYSYTRSSTFTETNVAYLASKVAADLRQMQSFYGQPSDQDISRYIEELCILLLGGWLGSVSYGYKRIVTWVIALKYEASYGSIRAADDNSGRVTPGIDISGAHWHSYLSKNYAYWRLSDNERNTIERRLPIQRTHGIEPRLTAGSWRSDKSYSTEGGALQRRIYY